MNEKQTVLDNLLHRKFFISSSFHQYGGVSGLYDFGPLGVALKQNILKIFRETFLEDNIYEIETSILTPYSVLKASGHVEKFCDTLVSDKITGECFRADHYLKEELEKRNINCPNIELMKLEEIDELVSKYQIKSPNGNELGNAKRFNLMFKTEIGAKTGNSVFLRPETAQGQFLSFKELYEMNGERLPFGSFTIGKAFRNEISPRGGLLRLREFEQAEIEYFVDPEDKKHARYEEIQDVEAMLVYEDKEVKMNIKDAVREKIIDNEVLGYFLIQTILFCEKIGINRDWLRLRQHEKDEMAHYACDCWDLEIKMGQGWVECAGIADRTCYDLMMHQKCSNSTFCAKKALSTPKSEVLWVPVIDKKKLGSKYRHRLNNLVQNIENLTQDYIEDNIKLNDNGIEGIVGISFDDEMINIPFKKEKRTIHVEHFLPHVIEPSFGVGRIFMAVLEHSFYMRDEKRNVLSLNPRIAPIQCYVSNLRNDLGKIDLNYIYTQLKNCNLRVKINTKEISIGKKYSLADEIGVPYFITIDTDTQTDRCVTIRERDSMSQIRIPITEVHEVLMPFCSGTENWNENVKNGKFKLL